MSALKLSSSESMNGAILPWQGSVGLLPQLSLGPDVGGVLPSKRITMMQQIKHKHPQVLVIHSTGSAAAHNVPLTMKT